MGWLLEYCPADYRGYAGWLKNPVVLAWLAQRHVAGQLEVMRQAYREARVELGPLIAPEALAEVMRHLEAEGLRLRAARRGTELIREALEGKTFVPRL